MSAIALAMELRKGYDEGGGVKKFVGFRFPPRVVEAIDKVVADSDENIDRTSIVLAAVCSYLAARHPETVEEILQKSEPEAKADLLLNLELFDSAA